MKSHSLLCLFLLLFSLHGYSQTCTLSVSISESEPTICSGNSITLTAVTSNGKAPFTYLWSTGETTNTISVNKAGNYTVSVKDNTPGCGAVKQSINVTSTVSPDPPTAANMVVCPNTPATLMATAPGGTYQWYDSGGNFLANGASYTTTNIQATTTYYVQTTVGGCTSSRAAVTVSLTARPTVFGATICSGTTAYLSTSGGDSFAWYANANATGVPLSTDPSYTTPVLIATTTYYVVVTTNGCASLPTAVTAKVTQGPQPPTAVSPGICAGSSVNLHADAPSGIFNWYNVANGGTPLISSPDYTTPVLNATTTYYVENEVNGCVSARTPVKVTVTQNPAKPVPQTYTICYNTSAVLTGGNDAALSYQWYDAPGGGNLLYTGQIFNTPVLTQSTTYYLELVNGGCGSGRSAVTVNVNQMVLAPSAPGVIICSGALATLTATSQSGTYQWYDAPTGGTLLSQANQYTTPALTVSTTYYVQNTVNGCIGPRAAVTVMVLSPAAPPTVTNTSVCYNNSAVLSASSPTDVYAWYATPTGGNQLSTAQVYVTPDLTTTTTYYVETSNASGCTSARAPLTVTVNAESPAPTGSGATTCQGTSATLMASASSGQLQWYATATGGNLLATGTSFNTPNLNATTTYYVQDVIAGCAGPRTPVTATVAAFIDLQFQYPGGTACSTAPNSVPVIYNPAGGTFSATPSGLVFVSTTTGVINTAASTPGVYEITFAGNGACPHISTIRFGVNTTSAQFSYAGPFCQDGIDPLPVFSPGASAGNFTATPAGLVFKDATTGAIDLANSIAGTYAVTNSIAATGNCAATSSMSTVTIYQRVNVNAGSSQTVEQGTPAQLAGSISGGITTGSWSGGTGTFSNPSAVNAIYTPGPGETVATLTLTSNDPPGPCGPHSGTITINFLPAPPAPVVQGTSLCDGTNTTLSATAPGGKYEWFATANATQVLASGPTFTTLWLTQTTTYYVQTTINGLVSARIAVTVIVNPVPVAPNVSPPPQTCADNPATLTATGSTGTYEWYDAATGGNLLFTGAIYVTPALQVNTTYYVQARENNCISPRTAVVVPVSNIPVITSGSSNIICTGTALNYTIQSDAVFPGYRWSRAAVTGISNPAVNNQTSGKITETLYNATNDPINVTYVILPFNGQCTGPSFNYVVIVNPQPMVTGPTTANICNNTTDNYQIVFNTPVNGYAWSRTAVPGISNATVTGQESSVIREVLFNTTTAPIVVPYIINFQTTTCTGTFLLNITVNPSTVITSARSGAVCSGDIQNYIITANIPGTTYIWNRNEVNNISNPAVTGQTSATIAESLINTGTGSVNVIYNITPVANGCDGTPFNYTVTVNPLPGKTTANTNSPVCVGGTIQLFTTPAPNTTYVWTAPNGTTYPTPNVTIDNASATNAGAYSVVATSSHGCPGPAAIYNVIVDPPGIPNAGPNQAVCIVAASINLTGSISGGPGNPVWSGGGGTFSSNTSLITQYFPSQADRASGSVKLILSAISPGGCSDTSSVTITFGQTAGVDAGPHQDVCSQETAVKLAGKTLLPVAVQWTTAGSGTFIPADGGIPDATYVPSAADEKSGSVILTLNVVNGGPCILQSDTMSIKFIGPPVLAPGGTVAVLKGNTVTLNPVVNESDLTYLWSPDIDISNINVKNPVITGVINRFYTLTVTDIRGCQTTDTTYINVSPAIIIPNTFTPNGDSINDQWNIQGLEAYSQATVDIFNRYGAKLFHSVGYPNPWDGTYLNKPVPSGEYYYVIRVNFQNIILAGHINLIR
jgi:gliding motility-associated-like protein